MESASSATINQFEVRDNESLVNRGSKKTDFKKRAFELKNGHLFIPIQVLFRRYRQKAASITISTTMIQSVTRGGILRILKKKAAEKKEARRLKNLRQKHKKQAQKAAAHAAIILSPVGSQPISRELFLTSASQKFREATFNKYNASNESTAYGKHILEIIYRSGLPMFPDAIAPLSTQYYILLQLLRKGSCSLIDLGKIIDGNNQIPQREYIALLAYLTKELEASVPITKIKQKGMDPQLQSKSSQEVIALVRPILVLVGKCVNLTTNRQCGIMLNMQYEHCAKTLYSWPELLKKTIAFYKETFIEIAENIPPRQQITGEYIRNIRKKASLPIFSAYINVREIFSSIDPNSLPSKCRKDLFLADINTTGPFAFLLNDIITGINTHGLNPFYRQWREMYVKEPTEGLGKKIALKLEECNCYHDEILAMIQSTFSDPKLLEIAKNTIEEGYKIKALSKWSRLSIMNAVLRNSVTDISFKEMIDPETGTYDEEKLMAYFSEKIKTLTNSDLFKTLKEEAKMFTSFSREAQVYLGSIENIFTFYQSTYINVVRNITKGITLITKAAEASLNLSIIMKRAGL